MTTLPLTIPNYFGDYSPPPLLARLGTSALAWNDRVAVDGASRLLPEFQEKPLLAAILLGCLAAAQDYEDGVWSVLIGCWIETAEGVQLDGLGVILDLPREGWVDDVYRPLLRAQVQVLGSDGSWDRLLLIMELMGVNVAPVQIADLPVGAMLVQLGEPLQVLTPALVFRFLVAAKAAVWRLSLWFPTVSVDDTFTLADGDAYQDDDRRGLADDALTIGGRLAGDLTTTENA